MRLFGVVDGFIDRKDRAAWLTGIFDGSFRVLPTLPREHVLAAAIADALNGATAGTFPLEFEAKRGHLVRYTTPELSTLRVSVAPIAKPSRPVARGVWNEEHTIGVEVLKKLEGNDHTAQLDELAELSERIETFLQRDELRELAGGVMVDVDRNPVAESEDLMKGKYRALIRATYHRELETEFAELVPPAADATLSGEHAIAEAIKDALNSAAGGTFGESFDATRHHLVRFDVPGLQTLRVSVAPLAKPSRPAARWVWNEQHTIGVAIQQKITSSAGNLDQLDNLALLSQQIEDYLRYDDLQYLAGGQLTEIARDPVLSFEALAEREYRAVLRLSYLRDIDTN
ncbi:hypothetical protein C5Y96_05685 [Blastopirellula marina]|uniref:Uncharacterized protein n=1 Tax=Blastopirellula marina TaxID=124 RepID=A0A2S8G4G9_9BACT|nr:MULTISPECIES: hypothetical protein [Pirellulaceae]PQO39345.1 hypothetical protein C5Y96_05685 [Blastopirellula marina]RCS55653.1 hypothetical protein DTL36_05695 [Bremerella cremea]